MGLDESGQWVTEGQDSFCYEFRGKVAVINMASVFLLLVFDAKQ